MKKHFKKLLALLIPAAFAGGILLTQDGKPVDIDSFTPPPLVFNGQSIPCAYKDENSNESVLVTTDKQTYSSWDSAYGVACVTNLSSDNQSFDIQMFHDGTSDITSFEELKPQVPYEVDVDDTKDVCKQIFNTETKKNMDVCSPQVVGSHKETRYRDEWGSIQKQNLDSSKERDAIKKVPSKFQLKDQFQYWIDSGQTKYFRFKLNFNLKDSGEFYIKAFGSMGAFGSLDPYYNSAWLYRVPITVDFTKIGTTTPITGFPVLFSTTTMPNLKFTGSGGHVGKSDGTDMLITAADGTTKLNHQIETYSSSTGQTIIWFQSSTSTPISTSTNTTYYLYYGNAAASDQQNITGVWDSNYKAVYHLTESPTGSAPQQKDSTSNANNLTVTTNSGSPVATSSQIGLGVNYPTTSEYAGTTAISAGNVGVGTTTSYTVSQWMNINSYLVVDGYPVQFSGTTGGTGFNIGPVVDTGDKLNFAINNVGGFGIKKTTSVTQTVGSWFYFTGTADGTNLNFYLNGVFQSSVALGTIGDGQALIGGSLANGVGFRFSDARYDEMRLSNTNRSASWIKTEYNNQFSPSTFYAVGAEENPPVTTVNSTSNSNMNGNININGNMNFN